MIGLVIVTHGALGEEFRAALEHVMGPQSQLEVLSIAADDQIEDRREDLLRAIARVETGGGTVVLTDMFGGTPSNLAISVMKTAHVEVLAGVNLPMLVKLASVRKDHDMAAAVEMAREAGQKYISIASEILSDR